MSIERPVFPEQQKLRDAESIIFGAELGNPMEFDLHGMDVLEARHEIEQALNQAFMAGEQVLKIVHGRGTGKLREAVHAYLKGNPLVEYYRDAEAIHSVGGVTYVVVIKK
ncbi:Smr/MutS family protein [Candidatus Uhrbacteria bacterium]|nr:Smr/MutS family protein [Candidatus Uhrbacteria bacterium]